MQKLNIIDTIGPRKSPIKYYSPRYEKGVITENEIKSFSPPHPRSAGSYGTIYDAAVRI